ncbi:MAG: hypothetical protein QM737_10585 [Ferruginibacter sp.]
MTSFFLFIGIVIVVGSLFFLLLKKRTTLFADNSIDADAVILNLQLTGLCIKNDIQVIIQLQVLPERGKSFVVEVKEMLSAAEYTQMHHGDKILVKYDPRNHKDVSIIKESFSRAFKVSQQVV